MSTARFWGEADKEFKIRRTKEHTNKLKKERTNEQSNKPEYKRTNEQTNELTNKRKDGRTGRRTIEQTNARTNERTNDRKNEYVGHYFSTIPRKSESQSRRIKLKTIHVGVHSISRYDSDDLSIRFKPQPVSHSYHT